MNDRYVRNGLNMVAPSLALIAMLAAGCGTAHVSGARQVGEPTSAPSVVYVSDFELDVRNVRTDRGILPPPPSLPGPGPALPKLPGSPSDPATRANEVVALMSRSLIKELEASGIQARRLRSGEAVPGEGWLVRGVFTSVQEGNQLHRAVVGFGAGRTDLQVLVAIDDLTDGAPKPMYSVETKADSGKLPGAVITLNPYVAAARFVIAGDDLDRNVKQSAAQIARQTAQRVSEARTTSR